MKKRVPGKPIRTISFFSGAGGLDIGFHLAGFQIIYATDIEPLFCDTLRENCQNYFTNEMAIESIDIRHLSPDNLPKNIDFVVGGPPCQTFSAVGRRAGGAAGRLDERGNLFKAYSDVIKAIKPKGFLFENVRGILGTNKGRDWDDIVREFNSLGYKISYRILDACDYGIPQHRERLFLVGHTLGGEFLFPAPTHGDDSSENRPHLTTGEAFQNLLENEDLEKLILRDGKYSHLLPLVPPGQNYLYFTEKRGYPDPIFAYRSRFSDFLYKADPEKPIKTIIASPGKYSGPLHWDNRYFSIAEYKRLQGFPDDYRFVGNRNETIKQIGNSVSPKIAFKLAQSIAKQLFAKKIDVELMQPEHKLSFDRRKGKQARQTRKKHLKIAKKVNRSRAYTFHDYESVILPSSFKKPVKNVRVECIKGNKIKMIVRGDQSKRIFLKTTLLLYSKEPNGDKYDPKIIAGEINITVFGEHAHCVQTLWNAIDDFVRRTSNYHSLFELYGHFTEPHPVFYVEDFKPYSIHPIVQFAEHFSDFKNCSRYFAKNHLVDLFGDVFGSENFSALAETLRGYRFDIRSKETNIAIEDDYYMVAYPFTLPELKQMNFSLKES